MQNRNCRLGGHLVGQAANGAALAPSPSRQLPPFAGSGKWKVIMAGLSANACLPHALTVAHQRLCEALDPGIRDFEAHQRFSNSQEICLAAETFVHEFCRVPARQAELERRVSLVDDRTRQESEFRKAMGTAWKAYRKKPKKPIEPEFLMERQYFSRLRKAICSLIYLAQVLKMRGYLERVIEARLLRPRVQAAFRDWLHQCWLIQREAEGLEVDGCYYLHHVYQATANPSKRSRSAKARIASGTFHAGVVLKPMRAAADSLMAWAAENRVCGHIADLVDAEAARLEKGVAEAQPAAKACGHSSPETSPHVAADPSDAAGRKTVGQQVPTSPLDHGQHRTGSEPAVLDDPITLEEAAGLLLLEAKTIQNRGTEGRPKPAIGGGKGKRAIWSYNTFRPWLLDNFPDREDRLPGDYEEAKKLFSAPKCPPGNS